MCQSTRPSLHHADSLTTPCRFVVRPPTMTVCVCVCSLWDNGESVTLTISALFHFIAALLFLLLDNGILQAMPTAQLKGWKKWWLIHYLDSKAFLLILLFVRVYLLLFLKTKCLITVINSVIFSNRTQNSNLSPISAFFYVSLVFLHFFFFSFCFILITNTYLFLC